MKTIPLANPIFIAVLAAVMTGCSSTLAPVYQRPASPVTNAWPDDSSTPLPATLSGQPAQKWQDIFADPKLCEVIDLALENNRDLRIAVLNIEKARSQYQIQRSELMPDIGLGVSGNSSRVPSSISSTGSGYTSHVYEVDLGITSWELDLFGRIRSLEDQALHEYMATQAAQRAARLGLIAQTAVAYIQLAADTEQLNVARETARSRLEAYDLQNQLQQIGSASELELRQAQAELDAARDDVLAWESAAATDRNALELVVGTPLPTTLQPTESLESMLAVRDLPAGLPSDLLRSRPDILGAEEALMAAEANIGAARAAFFPSISLTGGFGRASDSLNDLFSGANRTWSILPQINVPIFTGGRLKAGLAVSKVDRDIAVATYERSIQSAFKEVADALAIRSRIDGRLSAQQGRVEAASQAYALVKQRYDSGVASYLEVLDVQRTLYSAQQTWISTRLARQANLITLFKALGGDWQSQKNNNQVATTPEDRHTS
ncbi:efflux transporter outer membrane subunit [Pseudomonas sp. xss_2]|uniref:efflux transporter outer membrane subunit n=1 Tax=Pseudomonas sp. xss_2 TaxID=3367215 RepID=UPI00370AABB2